MRAAPPFACGAPHNPARSREANRAAASPAHPLPPPAPAHPLPTTHARAAARPRRLSALRAPSAPRLPPRTPLSADASCTPALAPPPRAEAAALLKLHGRNELEERSKPKWLLFLEQFYAPMPCMIWVACAVELLIEDWTDFWILLSLQFINASVSFYEAARAGDAVAALKAALKPAAVAKRDGRWVNLSAAELVPGDLVTLAAGAAVPADCVINGGAIDVDQAALTGESLPVGMVAGDRPKMGSTVSRGEVEATVEFTGARTFFGKTAAMIQSVEQLSNIQRVLIRIMVFLLAISFVLCGVCLAYLLIRGCVSFVPIDCHCLLTWHSRSVLCYPYPPESRSCTALRTWWCCLWRPFRLRWRL